MGNRERRVEEKIHEEAHSVERGKEVDDAKAIKLLDKRKLRVPPFIENMKAPPTSPYILFFFLLDTRHDPFRFL